jgi:Domain of unknown function (DUF4331)
MRRLNWKVLGLLGAPAVVAAGLSLARPAPAADHRDAPKTTAEAAADINDVYTFMDGNNYVLAMTVFPFADATAKFSDKVQYVFHTESGAEFGKTTSKTDIICTFTAAQVASCWVGSAGEYVTGDASAATGLASKSGKTKVFAGRRGDPFFFNLTGFKDAVKAVEAAPAFPTPPVAGCPGVDMGTAGALQGLLKETATTDMPTRTNADDFAAASGLALVVSVDKSLVTTGGPIVSVWASTNRQ